MFRRWFFRYWTRGQEEKIACNEGNLSANLKGLQHEKRENENHDRKRKFSSIKEKGFGDTLLKSVPGDEVDSSESSEEESEYDRKRKKVLEERQQMLRDIDIISAKNAVKEVVNKIREANKQQRETTGYLLRPRKPLTLRASMRLKGKDPELSDANIESTRPILEIPPRISADPIEMKLFGDDPENICNDYLLGIKPYLSQKLSGPVLEGDDLVSFRSRVQNMKLFPSCGQRVVLNRITTVAVHPSESNLLVAAGDSKGYLGFWKVNSKEESSMFQLHSRRVSHTSFSVYSPEKLITTSLDGTVRYSDLNKEVSTQIYASDDSTFGYHTYWHAEMSREVLLIAHGSGEVGIFDQRKGKLSYMYKCHRGLVRTVQSHPIAENYFVTGSGHRKAQIWDIRDGQKQKPKPVVDLSHRKRLTGCFFSPAGNYLLTTCTSGNVTVYDTSCFRHEMPEVVMRINCHGKRAPHAQAKWYPMREDAFVISNLWDSRRARVYDIHGQLVHGFMDPKIKGALHCSEFHPTMLSLISGSTTGRIYLFK